MAQLTPEQRRTRARLETIIRLMSPALDLVLAVGERISRLVEPVDHEYYPPRVGQVEPPAPGSEPRASED
jgi:hypothetical protein